MFSIELKYGLSMCLTPEHRVVHFSENTGERSITPLGEVMEIASRQQGFRGLIRTTFEVAKSSLFEEQALRLQVAVEADGYQHKKKVHVRVKSTRKKAQLTDLLRLTATPYREWIHTGYSTFSFTPPIFPKGQLYAIPVTEWGKEDLRILAEEAPLWDGDGKKTFRSTLKQSADCVQFAMASVGLRACMAAYPRLDKGHTEYVVRGNSRKDVSLRRAQYIPTPRSEKFCFTVPSGMLVLRRNGRIFVTGNTGVGKSDLLNQVAAHNIDTLERGGNFLPTAVFNYEAGPQVTGKGIVGKIMERRFHIPDPDGVYWTKKELEEAVDFVTQQCAKLFINDHQGATDWSSVKERVRYLKHTEDISDAFIDPMAALVATEDDERKALDRMMAESKMLAEELKIGLWFNTHVTRPSEGKSHEEGGRVALKHLRGSNAIGMWASFVFALERNQQGDEEERAVTTFRVLKDRFTGDSTGKTQGLRYNVLTGVLEVEDYNFEDEPKTVEPPPI
jgi:Cdc6-like AAA superfamily ATPase